MQVKTGKSKTRPSLSKGGLQRLQPVPWYLIDPTGMRVSQQRSNQATTSRLDGQGGGAWWRCSPQCLMHVPTLQPTWDIVTAVALIFTALVTPFEVGFLSPSTSAADPLWLINRLIDLVFVVDIIFQFFTMKPLGVDKAVDSGKEWEMDLRVLAYDYVCGGWFIIDAASIAPSALDFLPVLDAGDDAGGARVLRTLRALRLIKLARLAKSSRVVARINSELSLSCTAREVLVSGLQALLLTHWFACSLMVATTFAASPLNTWLATCGYCTPDDAEEEGYACVDDTAYMYLKVLKWAMALVFHNSLPMAIENGPHEPHYFEGNTHLSRLRSARRCCCCFSRCSASPSGRSPSPRSSDR